MFSAKHLLTGIAAAGVLAMAAASPALAEGKGDRAQQAMAEAQGKIDTAGKLPQVGETAHLEIDAQNALRQAHELVSAGHKEEAIHAALHASELADRATAVSLQQQHAANVDARSNAAAAQSDAAQANARADAAEGAAKAAQADAAAARAQPPVVIAQAAPVATQVTTETTKSTTATPAKAHVVKKVVRTPAHATTTEKTTTTVATTPQ